MSMNTITEHGLNLLIQRGPGLLLAILTLVTFMARTPFFLKIAPILSFLQTIFQKKNRAKIGI